MKKMLAIVIAVTLCLTMIPSVFAETSSGYEIIINNAVAGETYSAYKIFSMTDSDASGGKTYVAATGTYDSSIIYYEQNTDIATGVVSYTEKTGLNDGDDVSSYYVLRSGVAYSIKESDPWYSVVNDYASTPANGLTLTLSAGDASNKVVTITEGTFKAANFAAALKNALDVDAAAYADDPANYSRKYIPVDTKTTDGTGNGTTKATVTLDPGSAGYFFVDTSLGSLVALDSASKSVTMYEKNTTPTIDKKISETAGDYTDGPVNIDVGDTVYYQLIVTDGVGTDTAITVHDSMEAGLTLNPDSFAIQVNSEAVNASNYTIKVNNTAKVSNAHNYGDTADDNCTFEIVFNDSYVALLNQGEQIVITYNAVLNADAEIWDKDVSELTNDNSTHLTYGNQTTVDKTVKTKTYRFRVYKTDGTNPLAGVKFTLTKTEGGNTYYYQNAANTTTSGATTTSSVWTTTETKHETAKTGIIDFKGLDAGTYVLTETDTVSGYNPLTDTITVTIADDGTVTAKNTADASSVVVTAAASSGTLAEITPANFTVVNSQGSTLPSTGSVGTTLFYVGGGVLVLGAVVVLIAKKRTKASEE